MERSNASIKCWVNLDILKWAWGRTAPVRGRSSPVIILRRVDFPTKITIKNQNLLYNSLQFHNNLQWDIVVVEKVEKVKFNKLKLVHICINKKKICIILYIFIKLIKQIKQCEYIRTSSIWTNKSYSGIKINTEINTSIKNLTSWISKSNVITL